MSSPVRWEADGTPWSERFQDIYRSRGGADLSGLAQARHVFLGGCALLAQDGSPAAWAGATDWRVLETGFGLGLNFLATWQAWLEDPARPERLHYVGVEAWPPDAADLLRSVAHLPMLQPLAERLAAVWHGLLPGWHRFEFEGGRLRLTLCVGEVRAALRELAFAADSVFLDGFDPAQNPEMWDVHTLKAVARLCRPGTRAATWTVARAVREHLTQVGFVVEKAPGLPPKRDCLRARWAPAWTPRHAPYAPVWPAAQPGMALVIGAGLAGSSVGYSLALRGWSVTVLDRAEAPASGASGLPVGLVAPHVSPDDRALSQLTRAGVQATLTRAHRLLRVGEDWAPSGVLERCLAPSAAHAADPDANADHPTRGRRGRSLPPDWLQPGHPGTVWSRLADADDGAKAGLAPEDATHGAALWHARAAWLRPAALVRAQLAQPGIRFVGGCAVAGLKRQGARWRALDARGAVLAEADFVVVASGFDSLALLRAWTATPLPLHALRGQVAMGPMPAEAEALPRVPVNGWGSLIANVSIDARPGWIFGSTFERDCAEAVIRAGDVQQNLAKLSVLSPAAARQLAPQFAAGQTRAWAGVRCTAPDRVPLVGPLSRAGADPFEAPWVCTAMGARGLTLSVLCGELIAARIAGEPWPVPQRLAALLRAQRHTEVNAAR